MHPFEEIRARALEAAARIMARNNQPVNGTTTNIALKMAKRFEEYIESGDVDTTF